MACREVLLTLKRKGLISLPPRLHSANNEKRNRSVPVVEIEGIPLEGRPSDFEPVRLQLVRNTSFEPLYNSLIQQYHYLGYRQIVGNHLKYMAFIGEQPVACLGWGSAAWSVKSRDSFIGWDKPTKGTAKRGHDHLFHGKIKDVYLYPLGKDFRKKLTRLPLQGTSGQVG